MRRVIPVLRQASSTDVSGTGYYAAKNPVMS